MDPVAPAAHREISRAEPRRHRPPRAGRVFPAREHPVDQRLIVEAEEQDLELRSERAQVDGEVRGERRLADAPFGVRDAHDEEGARPGRLGLLRRRNPGLTRVVRIARGGPSVQGGRRVQP